MGKIIIGEELFVNQKLLFYQSKYEIIFFFQICIMQIIERKFAFFQLNNYCLIAKGYSSKVGK